MFYHNLDRQRIMLFLEALRQALIRIGIVTGLLAIGGYFCAEPVIVYLQHLTGAKLVAYNLPDTFFSFLKLALGLGWTAALPYTLYKLLVIVPSFFPGFSRKAFLCFWTASILLFGLGVFFCLHITLPYGIKFLLSFETTEITALISVKKFVSFCFWIIFGFGMIFELPLVMMLLSRIGVTDAERLGGYRRYTLIVILIVSAVLTPTPDIINMLLMAVPLYFLYEIGLIGMRLWRKSTSNDRTV